MIPLRLTVKNFMCYRDNVPVLDLEGVHVACLCGDNGHGKTALLDAITWALWGQARARTQSELVHQGQQDMAVELDFMAQGQHYRVSRRHSRSARSRQGTTILELQVVSDDSISPITGNTVRDTEKRVREILHMDYDTFVSTAFLRQGDADRFTTSKPPERKQTLAEVLDLSYYQALEDRAKSHSRDIQDLVRDAETAIELRQQEIARKPEHERELDSVKAALARIAPEVEAQRLHVQDSQNKVNSLDRQRPELEELTSRLAADQRDTDQLEVQVRNHESRVSEYEAVVQREPEVIENFAGLVQSREWLELLNQALARKGQLDGEKASFEKEVAVQRERLTGQAAQLRIRIDNDLEPKVKRLPEIEEELRAAGQEEGKLVEITETIRQTREEVRGLSAELEQLDRALDLKTGLDRRKAALEQEIAVKRAQLSGRSDQLRNKISQDLEPKAKRLSEIPEGLHLTAIEEERLDSLAETVRQRRGESEEIDGRARYLRQTNVDLRREMEDTRKKFDMLLEQDDALCPLCKHPLGTEGQEHLRLEYEATGLERKRQYELNAVELKDISNRHQELATTISRLETDHSKGQQQLQSKTVTLNRDLEESQNAEVELQSVTVALEQLEGIIRIENFAQEQRNKLVQLDAELSALGYDPERRSQLQTHIKEINEQVSQLETDLDHRRQQTRTKAAGLERDLEDCKKAQAELRPAAAALERLRSTIVAENFAHDERNKLRQLDAKLSELDYDARRHQQMREQVKALEGYDELHRKLQEASNGLPAERDALETSRQMLGRRRQETREAKERKSALEEELKTLPSLESQLRDAVARYSEMGRQRDETLVKQGVLKQQIERCIVLEAEVDQQGQERHRLLDEKSIYDDLAVAFGKNGIQALIIESAIPQLQSDATQLLGRLTEGRMSLKLDLKEGRRDMSTGLRAEELNIQIGDEVGTRSYETYSGGEAFRINFALRIALSKLLARRSGAPLPILFIDEGFGSQDVSGQERLIEAIKSIENEFQKIIVITHIEQIKEAFQQRIEVIKTENGSTFEMA